MVRETLLDYFHTVARQQGEYLVYDEGRARIKYILQMRF